MEGRIIDPTRLKALPQKDLIILVRQLRLFVRSLNMYPQDHPVLVEQAERLVSHLFETHKVHGHLLLDSRAHLLSVNERTIDKAVEELTWSVEVAAWLRERGVTSVGITGVLVSDDVLDVFGWLHSLPPERCRQLLFSGVRPDEKGFLTLNPGVEAAARKKKAPIAHEKEPETEEVPEEPTLGPLPHAGTGAAFDEADDTAMFSGRAVEVIEEDTLSGEMKFPTSRDAAIQRGLMATASQLFAGPYGPEGLLSALRAKADPVEPLVDELMGRFPNRARLNLEVVVRAQATEALCRLKAPDLAEFLAKAWAADSMGASLRRQVLDALEEKPGPAREAVSKLSNSVYGSPSGDAAAPAIEALEHLVPALLRSGHLLEPTRAVQVLSAMVSKEDHPGTLRARCNMALRRISRLGVLRSLLARLRAHPSGDPALEEVLFLLASSSVARLVEELRDADEREVRLDLVDVLTVVGRMAHARGQDADAVLAPLKRVLESGDTVPWYLVRNVALILGNVGTPGMREQLQARLREEREPRVISEVALGLMDSASPETVRLLGQTLFGGRLASPEAFEQLMPLLLEHDRRGTLKGIENLLLEGSLTPAAMTAALRALVITAEEESAPTLTRILTGRPLFRRNLSFSEPIRLAAVEALAAASGDWGKATLLKAASDPSTTVQARVQALVGEHEVTAVFAPVPDRDGE